MSKVKLALAETALEVYEHMVAASDSFEADDIGADLAYLMGALLREGYCVWPKTRPIIALLMEKYHDSHPIWGYIRVESEEV